MRLAPDDFPLRNIGTLIYARMTSSPCLTASTPQVAQQVVTALNALAKDEQPGLDMRDWLVIQ